METRPANVTTSSGAGHPSEADAQPAELAPEHLRLLEQLAASRTARRANSPANVAHRPDPSVPGDMGESELVRENQRLRSYIAVLEAAVTVLLDSADHSSAEADERRRTSIEPASETSR
ncbi:hypothetical protein AB0D08_06795 [Kitasatospora sp. NPDC048540]|uniref:hypothetical protein n=1 Tax=Kitasatospora sp. NPDC048540 TaxID=3155634 RepID=UPI0033D6E221